MNLHEEVFLRLKQGFANAEQGTDNLLNSALRLLCKWRAALVQNTFKKNSDTVVLGGLFEGLDLLDGSSEGCHVPKILGCYEQPLHREFRRLMKNNYDILINIGCAEGYYAVGFARLLHEIQIYAFDIDDNAQKKCKQLAAKNGVGSRVFVEGEFTHADLKKYASSRVLILCDIEGAENDLLDPGKAPDLKSTDIIVEVHELMQPGLLEVLTKRFERTHYIKLVEDDGQRQLCAMPKWFKTWSHLDQLLAVWEWREGPTPWLICEAKKPF